MFVRWRRSRDYLRVSKHAPRAILPGMDPITLAFYAIVCGCLSAVAPNFPKLPVRLGIGALVGLVAASVLPMIKGMLPLY